MRPRIRTYAELGGKDVSDLPGQIREQAERVARRLSGVRHVVAVTSGKGGVGKSFAAAALAEAARAGGATVGLVDADLNGPTARRLLGVGRGTLPVDREGVRPLATPSGVALISMDLLLKEGDPLEWREPRSESFVWRGAQERGALREFLADVAWGERDLLLVDLPPGTQRLVDLAELLPRLAGVLAVTLPSGASRASVERGLELARRRGIRLLGILENMAGYACPRCGEAGPLFPGDAGGRLAALFSAPLLGRVPFDPEAAALAEEGRMTEVLERTRAGTALRDAALRLWSTLEGEEGAQG